MKKHALGIVVQNRWELTQKTLESLYCTDQPKDTYDLYIIDNGSDPLISANLVEWCKSAIVPVKNLIKTKLLGIGPAWNLFLSITTQYPYRTKLDNDLIFANTPIADKPFKRQEHNTNRMTPNEFGVNPGSIPTVAFVMGAGNKIKKRNHNQYHTCFLEHVENAINESKLGICAIPTVSVGHTLVNTMSLLGKKRWRKNPILIGGCMTITKSTFDVLGYFDDKLPAHIDWEYSQRAMAHGINIGYTPHYCVIHLGEHNPTLSTDIRQKNEMKVKMMESQLEFKRGFVHTKWESVNQKIITAARKSMIVNLT